VSTDQSRHTLSAAGARDDAQRHLGHAEAGLRSGHAVVAGQRDLQPTAHDGTVHRSDHRHRQILVAVEQAPVFLFARRTGELTDIRTREESAALAPEHDRGDIRPRKDSLQRQGQSFSHCRSDGVDGRVVNGDDGDLAVTRHADDIGLGQVEIPRHWVHDLAAAAVI
jgi:hypothetical protein